MTEPRVLHVITGLSVGGAERALYKALAGGLAARFGNAVISLRTPGSVGDRIEALGVPVETLGIDASLPGPRAVARLRRLVRKFAPDVIQGWMYHGNLAASAAAGLAPGVRAVAWNVRHSLISLEREPLLMRQVIRANRWLSRRPEAIVYNSQVARRQHESFGFHAACGRVIPNGFDVKRLAPGCRESARDLLLLPPEAQVVGHVARFHPMKDHRSFLLAAVQVARALPHARFVLVGRDVEPDYPALAGLLPEALRDRFVFLGERRDVAELMPAMDVLCVSSAWGEAFPNVLGEAMACAIPCVTTDVGDSAAVVGECGAVVPPGDMEALTQALIELLSQPVETRRELGRAARERIENHFAEEATVARYSALYESLMACAPSERPPEPPQR